MSRFGSCVLVWVLLPDLGRDESVLTLSDVFLRPSAVASWGADHT